MTLTSKNVCILTIILLWPAQCAPVRAGECQRVKILAPDAIANGWFGFSVAVDGDTAVIGALGSQGVDGWGAAYVYRLTSAGWTFEDKLRANDPLFYQDFGYSVSVSGHTVIVGAPRSDVAGDYSGAVYVYDRDPNDVWSRTAKLWPSDARTMDFFGQAVAVSGDTIIATSVEDDDNGAQSGSAYVFKRDPNGVWNETTKLLPDDGDSYDFFGDWMAFDGQTAVISAPDDEDQGNYSGSAYVFERDSNGDWCQAAKLLASDGRPFSSFGVGVAVGGDSVMIGANEVDGNQPNSGAAYLYQRDPNGVWSELTKLSPADTETWDHFGFDMAIDDDFAIIGANGDDDHGAYSGSAYIFQRDAGGAWVEAGKLVPNDGDDHEYFGQRVAISGNIAVCGVHWDDDFGAMTGSAYIFAVGPDDDGDGVMDVCRCPDLNSDGEVQLIDLVILLSNYRAPGDPTWYNGDLNADGTVNLADLAELLSEYGTVCP